MSEKYSKEYIIQNGLDIQEAIPFIGTRQLLDSTVGFTHTVLVDYLNSHGHPLAAQALDDLWTPREDQWHRQDPDCFDKRYLTGEELFEARGDYENNS